MSWIERANGERIVLSEAPLTAVLTARPRAGGGSARHFSADEMVRLYVEEGLSASGVAARLGCTPQLVRIRLADAAVPLRRKNP